MPEAAGIRRVAADMNVRSVIPGASSHVKGFFQFVREQGIVGFAIGFIIGGAVSN